MIPLPLPRPWPMPHLRTSSIRFLGALIFSLTACGTLQAADDGICLATIEVPVRWEKALDRLVRCNPDVQLAAQQLNMSKADLTIAGQRPNPIASFSASSINPQRIRPSGQELQVDWQGRIDQLIELGNKRGLRVNAAESGVLASQWLSADAMRTTLLALSYAWIDLWAAQEKERLIDGSLADFRRIWNLSKIRYQAGDIAKADLNRITIDLQRIENDREQARIDRARAQQNMAFLLSTSSDQRELLLASPWPAIQGDFPFVDPIEVRPEIASANALLDKARAARELAQSLQTRDVSLGVSIDRYPGPAGDGTTLGLYASVPLFAWHRHEGEIARAEAEYTSALIGRRRVESQALTEQNKALHDRSVSLLRWKGLRDNALPLGESVAASIQLAHQQRAIGILDLLDALRTQRQLQIDTLASRIDFEKADAVARATLRVSPQANDPVFRLVGAPAQALPR